ncbi:MAG: hypothetical protein DI594_11350 [Shewanella oneidensis]|nr:MAG: hypothetical protein DI594_11350 [Shewanella oneidensis]
MAENLTLILYYLPFLSLFLYAFKVDNKKINKNLTAFLILLCLFFLLSFRYDVGWDYLTYYEIFFATDDQKFEPFSQLVLSLSRLVGSVDIMYVIFALVTIVPIFFSYLNFRHISLLVFYISFPFFFLESFSVMRQGAAISFCILAYSFYLRRSNLYIVFSLIALLFHYSALMFFLMMLFCRISNDRFKLISIFVLVFVYFNLNAILLSLSAFFPKLLFYTSGTAFGLLSLFSIFLLFFVSISKSECFEKYYIIFVGLTLNLILIGFDSVLTRVCWYFYIPFCFLKWDFVCYKVKFNKILFLIMMLVFYSYTIFLKSNFEHGSYLPYKTNLFKLL